MKTQLTYSLLVLAVLLILFSCKDELTQPPAIQPLNQSNEKGLYEYARFPIGTAYNEENIRPGLNVNWLPILNREFNSLTCENCMKFGSISTAKGSYNWTEADAFVDFAVQNGKRIHGHVLVWRRQYPNWLDTYSATTEEWDTLLKNHIYTTIGRYKGEIEGWDVVNEAFEYESSSLATCIWRDHLGDGYVEKSFLYASQADPNALLFYNEAQLEDPRNPHKIDSVLAFLDGIKAKGIRIDGFGIQMHIPHVDFLSPEVDTTLIRNIVKKVVAKGYKVHLSELDVPMNWFGSHKGKPTLEIFNKQAWVYHWVAKMYVQEVPENLQYGITMWGFCDKNSWIPGESPSGADDWPNLFDSSYQKKPAYFAFRDGLK